jgi:hypothetical protein
MEFVGKKFFKVVSNFLGLLEKFLTPERRLLKTLNPKW